MSGYPSHHKGRPTFFRSEVSTLSSVLRVLSASPVVYSLLLWQF